MRSAGSCQFRLQNFHGDLSLSRACVATVPLHVFGFRSQSATSGSIRDSACDNRGMSGETKGAGAAAPTVESFFKEQKWSDIYTLCEQKELDVRPWFCGCSGQSSLLSRLQEGGALKDSSANTFAIAILSALLMEQP